VGLPKGQGTTYFNQTGKRAVLGRGRFTLQASYMTKSIRQRPRALHILGRRNIPGSIGGSIPDQRRQKVCAENAHALLVVPKSVPSWAEDRRPTSSVNVGRSATGKRLNCSRRRSRKSVRSWRGRQSRITRFDRRTAVILARSNMGWIQGGLWQAGRLATDVRRRAKWEAERTEKIWRPQLERARNVVIDGAAVLARRSKAALGLMKSPKFWRGRVLRAGRLAKALTRAESRALRLEHLSNLKGARIRSRFGICACGIRFGPAVGLGVAASHRSRCAACLEDDSEIVAAAASVARKVSQGVSLLHSRQVARQNAIPRLDRVARAADPRFWGSLGAHLPEPVE